MSPAVPKPSRQLRLKERARLREADILRRAELRHDCLQRGNYQCENPDCRADLILTGAVFDHWLGGSGRRRPQESLATTWVLCLNCNEERTLNVPDAQTWNSRWKAHTMRYSYSYTPHLTKYQMLAAERGDG